MMKKIYLLLFIFLWVGSLSAQDPGMNMTYQATARNATGQVLPQTTVRVELSFVSPSVGEETYYSEIHEINTDQNGHFSLQMGAGQANQGEFDQIPWSAQTVWVKTKIFLPSDPQAFFQQQSALVSVPYAMYAQTASELVPAKEADLRNHSIYWLTGGNRDTRPPIHFLGTRDNVDFVIKVDEKEFTRFKADGRTIVKTELTGADSKIDSYPYVVQGGKQGIWININEPREGKNNFVTFEDNTGVQGRIEGQTTGELASSPAFIIQQVGFALELTKLGLSLGTNIAEGSTDAAGAVASGASIFFAWQVPGWVTASVAQIAQSIGAGVELAATIANIATTNAIALNDIGVSYSSGNGDYAEYLERFAVESDMLAGEIVAVIGGKLTRNTEGATMVKIISEAPAILGNMPQPVVASLYEKVAFLGQVRVRVAGAVNAGDYIIPSGNNDGVGIAIAPTAMKIEDYAQVVGIAWESHPKQPLNLVLVGIGLNQNDLAPQVKLVSKKVDNILQYLEGKGPLEPLPSIEEMAANVPAQPGLKKLWTNEEFDAMVDAKAPDLEVIYQQYFKELEASPLDIDQVPGFREFMKDPVNGLKKMRRDPQFDQYWAQLDAFIQLHNKQENH